MKKENNNKVETKKLKTDNQRMVKLIKEYYKNGGNGILNQIILEFEPLMYKLAKPFFSHASVQSYRASIDDFIQEARIELCECLMNKTYDPKRSAPITFFYQLINNRLIDYDNRNMSEFSITDRTKEKIAALKNYNTYIQDGMVKSKALRKAKLKKEDLKKYTVRTTKSLDSVAFDEDKEPVLLRDVIGPSENQETTEQTLIKDDFYNVLKKNLTADEFKYLIANNVDNLSMREIAEENKVTVIEVKRILMRALRKCRASEELKGFIGAFNQ